MERRNTNGQFDYHIHRSAAQTTRLFVADAGRPLTLGPVAGPGKFELAVERDFQRSTLHRNLRPPIAIQDDTTFAMIGLPGARLTFYRMHGSVIDCAIGQSGFLDLA